MPWELITLNGIFDYCYPIDQFNGDYALSVGHSGRECAAAATTSAAAAMWKPKPATPNAVADSRC